MNDHICTMYHVRKDRVPVNKIKNAWYWIGGGKGAILIDMHCFDSNVKVPLQKDLQIKGRWNNKREK